MRRMTGKERIAYLRDEEGRKKRLLTSIRKIGEDADWPRAERQLQISTMHTFDPGKVWDICKMNSHYALFVSYIDPLCEGYFKPGYFNVSESPELKSLLEKLTSKSVSLQYIPCSGADGTIYTVKLGDHWGNMTLSWWADGPKEWEPFTTAFFEVLERLEELTPEYPGPKRNEPSKGPWTWSAADNPEVVQLIENFPDTDEWMMDIQYAATDELTGKMLCACAASAVAREACTRNGYSSDTLDLLDAWINDPTYDNLELIYIWTKEVDRRKIESLPDDYFWGPMYLAVLPESTPNASWMLRGTILTAMKAGLSREEVQKLTKQAIYKRRT